MKYVIYLLMVFLKTENTSDCKTIQTGRFTNAERDTKITRTKTHQTELSEKNNLHFIFKTQWINDCEYYMILEKDYSTDPFKVFKVGDTIQIKLVRVDKGKYDWEAEYKGKLFKGFNYILR